MDSIMSNRKENRTLYNFLSANKIYFASTPSKLFLLEKKKSKLVLSLVSRNTVLCTKDGTLLFPRNK